MEINIEAFKITYQKKGGIDRVESVNTKDRREFVEVEAKYLLSLMKAGYSHEETNARIWKEMIECPKIKASLH